MTQPNPVDQAQGGALAQMVKQNLAHQVRDALNDAGVQRADPDFTRDLLVVLPEGKFQDVCGDALLVNLDSVYTPIAVRQTLDVIKAKNYHAVTMDVVPADGKPGYSARVSLSNDARALDETPRDDYAATSEMLVQKSAELAQRSVAKAQAAQAPKP